MFAPFFGRHFRLPQRFTNMAALFQAGRSLYIYKKKMTEVLNMLPEAGKYFTMPYKTQPIRLLKSHCLLDGITSNLFIVRCAYVALLVQVTVFSMTWYKKVMQRFLMIYCTISHLSLLNFCLRNHLSITSMFFLSSCLLQNSSLQWNVMADVLPERFNGVLLSLKILSD